MLTLPLADRDRCDDPVGLLLEQICTSLNLIQKLKIQLWFGDVLHFLITFLV